MAYIHRERGNSITIRHNCGYDLNGKKKFVTKTITIPEGIGKKARERMIREAMDELERKVRGGAKYHTDKIRFKDFVSGMYEKNHLSTLKENTADGYRRDITKRLLPFFGEMYLRDITSLDVREWIASLERADKSDTPLSENSKGVWFRTLSAILGKAKEWEIIDSNPCDNVKQPRKAGSDVKALEQEEVERVFEACDTYDDIRIIILIKILLLTGMRNAEVCGLQWNDINFEDCSIKVNRECVYITGKGFIESEPKSKSSKRTIYIPEALRDDLKQYKEYEFKQIRERGDLWIGNTGESAKLFTQFDGKPVARRTIKFWVEKFSKDCKIPYVTVHGLRHTFASLLISNGIDARTAAAQMGHSSPYLVYNTYANPQENAKRRAANLMGDIVSKKKDGSR